MNPEDVKEPSEHGVVSATTSPVLPVMALGKHRPGASWMGGQWPLSEQGFVAKLGGQRTLAGQGLSCWWGFPIYLLTRSEMEKMTFIGEVVQDGDCTRELEFKGN